MSARGAWSAGATAETCVSHPSSKADRVPQCLMEPLMFSSGSVPTQGQLLPQGRDKAEQSPAPLQTAQVSAYVDF